MNALSERVGRAVTREDVLAELFASGSLMPSDLKRAFRQVLVDALTTLAARIRDAVHAVSPDTQLGFMPASFPWFGWGHDFGAVARALAGDRHRPLLRPHVWVYTDTDRNPTEFFSYFQQPAVIRALFGDDIEYHPEMENYPYGEYNKTAQMTRMQITAVHLLGLHRQALSIADSCGTPFSRFESTISMLEQRRGYFQALVDTIPEGARTSGVALWQHREGHLYHRIRPDAGRTVNCLNPSDLGNLSSRQSAEKNMMMLMPERRADQFIPLLGLPPGYRWEDADGHLLLAGDDVLALTDAERDRLLQNGAILDRRACECLLALGWGDRIGVRFDGIVQDEDGRGTERFTSDTLPGTHAGRIHPSLGLGNGHCSRLTLAPNSQGRVLSWLVNAQGREVTPLVAATENAQGVRWGVLAFDMDSISRFSFVHESRASQFNALLAWIARKPLPVVVSGHPYIIPVYIDLDPHTSILALGNYSTGTADHPRIYLGRGHPDRIEALLPDGHWENRTAQFQTDASGALLPTRSLPPYETDVYRLTWGAEIP